MDYVNKWTVCFASTLGDDPREERVFWNYHEAIAFHDGLVASGVMDSYVRDPDGVVRNMVARCIGCVSGKHDENYNH